MKDFDRWPLVYGDSQLEIKRDPRGTEDYGLMIKANENYLNLPRGTINPIAMSHVEEGNKKIQETIEKQYLRRGVEEFIEGTPVNLYYLNAAITKAHFFAEVEKWKEQFSVGNFKKFFKDLHEDRKDIPLTQRS
ncbi:MAG: hypothetical protein ABIB79_02015 [archaeon]